MKKIIGYLSIILLTLLTLTACSSKSVYKIYEKEGVKLGKDTVYQLVTAEEFVEKKSSTQDIIYLFYGSAKNFESKQAITVIQEQAKQYNVSVIYYIDADLYDTKAKRDELKSKIEINDAAKVPTLLAYNCEDEEPETKYVFDTSKTEFSRHFYTDGKMDYTKVAGFMFREKCNKTELPNL